MITTESLSRNDRVRHGFFGREGGVSTGIYASLNCGWGSSDTRANVIENRTRAARALGIEGDRLLSLYQIHSPDVVVVEDPWLPGDGPQADGMVTTRPGIALGVLTADCAPVLFADPEAGVVGTAHAGWKGALSGVLEATVDTMLTMGAARQRIAAALGPCIRQPSYEVGPEFTDRFVADDAANRRFFRPSGRDGHSLFDLAGYVLGRLDALDLGTVEDTGGDTCAEDRLYFSYRRATKRGDPDYGRAVSAIALRD